MPCGQAKRYALSFLIDLGSIGFLMVFLNIIVTKYLYKFYGNLIHLFQELLTSIIIIQNNIYVKQSSFQDVWQIAMIDL